MEKIPYIRVNAQSHYDFGWKIGEALRHQFQERLASNKILYREHGKKFDDLIIESRKFIPEVENLYPDILHELQGLADGAQMAFSELFVLVCEEELLDYRIHKCTTLAINTKGGVLFGHNEDWIASYRTNGLYIIHGTIDSEEFLSLSYMGSLPGTSCSINKHGMCFSGNSLSSKRFRYGVPKSVQMRALLHASTQHEAQKIDTTDSSIVGNQMYAWDSGVMFDVEDLYKHHEVFTSNRYLIHTNHPLKKEDQNKVNTDPESMKRLERAKKILDGEPVLTKQSLLAVLRDHETGICSHFDTKHPHYGVTIASVIMSPKERFMEVAQGNPCVNDFHKYTL